MSCLRRFFLRCRASHSSSLPASGPMSLHFLKFARFLASNDILDLGAPESSASVIHGHGQIRSANQRFHESLGPLAIGAGTGGDDVDIDSWGGPAVFQESRADATATKLKAMISVTATVLRDGWEEENSAPAARSR